MPGWQDRRGKPLPLTGIGIHAAVIDPRCGDSDRPGGGQDLTFAVIAVADHQAAAVLVDLVGELLHISGDLGLQSRR